MLKEAKLLLEFWDEVTEADVYQRNRIMKGPKAIGTNQDMSPEEAYTSKILSIDYMKV